MKFAWLFLTVGAALLGTACSSSPGERIEKNPRLFQVLGAREKAQVSRGEIAEGMDRNAVWLAWGKADRIFSGARLGKTYERWSYTGYEPVHGTALGFGFGAGYSRHHRFAGRNPHYDSHFYSEPTLHYVPYESRHVEFAGGRVIAWATGR